MSAKKYPYIGDNFGQTVLIYGKDSAFHISGQYQGEFSDAYNETMVRNITREYLTNTYGKCESQEHADFVCKLAENCGFNVINDYSELKGRIWFVITCYKIEFFSMPHDTKLIHLPLPPKEKEMENKTIAPSEKGSEMWVKEQKPKITLFYKTNPDEPFLSETSDIEIAKTEDLHIKIINHTSEHIQFIPKDNTLQIGGFKILNNDGTEQKPIYTKEMHERGERPPIGSEIVIRYNFDSKTVTHRGEVLYISNRNIILNQGGVDVHYRASEYLIEPIPTIEDELVDYFEGVFASVKYGVEGNKFLARDLTEKYNITPKGE